MAPSRDQAHPTFAGRILATIRVVLRFLLHSKFRSEQITRLRHGRHHFQGETHTQPDRYPALFSACSTLLADIPRPAILSFGCSTGDEVFSLAGYVTQATITGVDLNRWALRRAVRRNQNPRLHFLHRHSRQFAALTGLDAIFCMAVFQRTENRTEAAASSKNASGITFQRFEQELLLLDSKLKTGGLLFLDHADFAFEDTILAPRYTPVDFPRSAVRRERPLFRPDHSVAAHGHLMQRCFRKQGL